MSASCVHGEVRASGSARMRAGAPWNASGNANGAGAGDAARSPDGNHGRGSRERESCLKMSLTY
jgi:hypothetical protein